MTRAYVTAEDLLDDFIKEAELYFANKSVGSFNRWIEPEGDTLRAYVRRSNRIAPYSGGRLIVTLDIGSVTVDNPGEGRFTTFLRFIEHLKPFDGLYVESVLDPRFADFFLRRPGYQLIDYLGNPTFIRLWNE